MNGQQGEFVGAIYFCFNIYPPTQNIYYTALTRLDMGPDVLLIDGNQRVIYSPDPSQLGKDLSKEAYISKASSRKEYEHPVPKRD